MSGSGPALKAVVELNNISHLPASVNGSVALYMSTLTAMMCGTVLGLYVLFWMAKDMIRDRQHAGFKSVLFNFRLMMGMIGGAAVMACLPEVFYLQMYGDPRVTVEAQAVVTTAKRIADSLRIYVIIGWVSILVMIYPYICLALYNRTNGKIYAAAVTDYPGMARLLKPAIIFIILAIVAAAFAMSKVNGH